MSLGKPRSTPELLGLIAICITVIGGLWAGGNQIYDIVSLVATKEYHDVDVETKIDAKLEPIQQDVQYTVSAVAVPRMQNILDLKCRTNGDIPPEVETILQRTKKRYREIEGREYDEGFCLPTGERISTYEARQNGLID